MSLPLSDLELCEFHCRDQTVRIVTCITVHGSVLSDEFDLTGFMVWPASHLLCSWLLSNSDRLKDKTVIELGSGSGLCGILASRFAGKAVLSDMCMPILEVVQDHLEEYDWDKVQCRELLWGDEKHLQALTTEFPDGFDMILAADVVYPEADSLKRLNDLLVTVVAFLRSCPGSTFVCAHVSRNQAVDIEFANVAVAKGLMWTTMPSAEFVQEGDYFPSILEGACIISFSLQSWNAGQDMTATSGCKIEPYSASNLPEWSTTTMGRYTSPEPSPLWDITL